MKAELQTYNASTVLSTVTDEKMHSANRTRDIEEVKKQHALPRELLRELVFFIPLTNCLSLQRERGVNSYEFYSYLNSFTPKLAIAAFVGDIRNFVANQVIYNTGMTVWKEMKTNSTMGKHIAAFWFLHDYLNETGTNFAPNADGTSRRGRLCHFMVAKLFLEFCKQCPKYADGREIITWLPELKVQAMQIAENRRTNGNCAICIKNGNGEDYCLVAFEQ